MNFDLIVVGTSFASTFFLKKFLEKSSPTVRVLVLERGEFEPQANRLLKAKKIPFGDVGYVTSSSSNGDTYTNTNLSKPWLFDTSFGGGSNCWTGCTPRFLPDDFRMFSKYGIGMDWPIQYNDIEEYYCQVEEIMSISGPEVTPYPMSKPYPLPPHQLTTVDKILNQQYGDLYISQPTARASKTGNRNACCGSSICHLCPVGAKFNIENGLMSVYSDPRVEVQYNSLVTELDIQNSIAKSVVVIQNGKESNIKGNAIALGANPIFNSHILLKSGDTNRNTGRYLSEQVGYYGYVYLKDLNNVGGSTIITANGYNLYNTPDRSTVAGCLIESHNDPYVRADFNKWRQVVKFKFVFEDIPQEGNRVIVGKDNSLPVVEYKGHTEYVKRGHTNLKEKIDSLFDILPVEKIMLDDNFQATEAHILGATRMSNQSDTGVIDKHLIHHTYRNVFVLGGGAFPTITPSNPTLTLSALSLWSADKNF